MGHLEQFPGTDVHKTHRGEAADVGEDIQDQFEIRINDVRCQARLGELLIESINQLALEIPQVYYHPQLGAIQTCDTCMVEVDGQL
jgi:hypothetical protein